MRRYDILEKYELTIKDTVIRFVLRNEYRKKYKNNRLVQYIFKHHNYGVNVTIGKKYYAVEYIDDNGYRIDIFNIESKELIKYYYI